MQFVGVIHLLVSPKLLSYGLSAILNHLLVFLQGVAAWRLFDVSVF